MVLRELRHKNKGRRAIFLRRRWQRNACSRLRIQNEKTCGHRISNPTSTGPSPASKRDDVNQKCRFKSGHIPGMWFLEPETTHLISNYQGKETFAHCVHVTLVTGRDGGVGMEPPV